MKKFLAALLMLAVFFSAAGPAPARPRGGRMAQKAREAVYKKLKDSDDEAGTNLTNLMSGLTAAFKDTTLLNEEQKNAVIRLWESDKAGARTLAQSYIKDNLAAMEPAERDTKLAAEKALFVKALTDAGVKDAVTAASQAVRDDWFADPDNAAAVSNIEHWHLARTTLKEALAKLEGRPEYAAIEGLDRGMLAAQLSRLNSGQLANLRSFDADELVNLVKLPAEYQAIALGMDETQRDAAKADAIAGIRAEAGYDAMSPGDRARFDQELAEHYTAFDSGAWNAHIAAMQTAMADARTATQTGFKTEWGEQHARWLEENEDGLAAYAKYLDDLDAEGNRDPVQEEVDWKEEHETQITAYKNWLEWQEANDFDIDEYQSAQLSWMINNSKDPYVEVGYWPPWEFSDKAKLSETYRREGTDTYYKNLLKPYAHEVQYDFAPGLSLVWDETLDFRHNWRIETNGAIAGEITVRMTWFMPIVIKNKITITTKQTTYYLEGLAESDMDALLACNITSDVFLMAEPQELPDYAWAEDPGRYEYVPNEIAPVDKPEFTFDRDTVSVTNPAFASFEYGDFSFAATSRPAAPRGPGGGSRGGSTSAAGYEPAPLAPVVEVADEAVPLAPLPFGALPLTGESSLLSMLYLGLALSMAAMGAAGLMLCKKPRSLEA